MATEVVLVALAAFAAAMVAAVAGFGGAVVLLAPKAPPSHGRATRGA